MVWRNCTFGNLQVWGYSLTLPKTVTATTGGFNWVKIPDLYVYGYSAGSLPYAKAVFKINGVAKVSGSVSATGTYSTTTTIAPATRSQSIVASSSNDVALYLSTGSTYGRAKLNTAMQINDQYTVMK